jgi:hypothetical protein
MVVQKNTKAPGTMALVLGSTRPPILGNSASAGRYELPFTSRWIEVHTSYVKSTSPTPTPST